MCPECRHPFRAQSSRDKMIDVVDGAVEVPKEAWLSVCPCCSHTELVPDDGNPHPYCSRCGAVLTPPVVRSKRVRKVSEEPGDKSTTDHTENTDQ
jgi:hypothetical protein